MIIIGSGPAGWSAAIYTARADLRPLLITGNELGGQIALTTEVENFPGFEKQSRGRSWWSGCSGRPSASAPRC